MQPGGKAAKDVVNTFLDAPQYAVIKSFLELLSRKMQVYT